MRTKQSTIQGSDLPNGSIYLDDLIQRYLVGIGLRQFASLTPQEITQFAFLSLSRTIQKCELIGADRENLWDCVMPDLKVAHVCLLPDTPEARKYFHTSGEPTILFKGVEDVRAFLRTVFLNLIIDEIKKEKRQERIKDAITWDHTPLRRRRLANDVGYQSLEAYARHRYNQDEVVDKEVLNRELRVLAEECLGDIDFDLLMAYLEGGVEDFQALYFNYYGKRISRDAARKTFSRRLDKLAKYIQKKSNLHRVV